MLGPLRKKLGQARQVATRRQLHLELEAREERNQVEHRRATALCDRTDCWVRQQPDQC